MVNFGPFSHRYQIHNFFAMILILTFSAPTCLKFYKLLIFDTNFINVAEYWPNFHLESFRVTSQKSCEFDNVVNLTSVRATLIDSTFPMSLTEKNRVGR